VRSHRLTSWEYLGVKGWTSELFGDRRTRVAGSGAMAFEAFRSYDGKNAMLATWPNFNQC